MKDPIIYCVLSDCGCYLRTHLFEDWIPQWQLENLAPLTTPSQGPVVVVVDCALFCPCEGISIPPKHMVSWKETLMIVKPWHFASMLQIWPPYLNLTNRTWQSPMCTLPDNIPYAGKTFTVHINAAFILNVWLHECHTYQHPHSTMFSTHQWVAARTHQFCFSNCWVLELQMAETYMA